MNSETQPLQLLRAAIASESFSLERGGAARVGRLMARFAADEFGQSSLLGLSDAKATDDFGVTSHTANGQRLRFATQCWWASLSHDLFLYNHLGITRAHCRLPVLKKPYVVWMLGLDAWGERMTGDYGAAADDAALLLSISDFTTSRAKIIRPSVARAITCWLATEEDEDAAAVPERNGPPTAMILSRIDARQDHKGHNDLIDCWPDVVSVVPEARLVIAGGGSGLAALQKRVDTSPVAAAIQCTGFVPQEQIDDIWAKTDVFAMPSRGDGFGLVYIEAMRRGIPVLASRQDAGQEVNAHGESGLNADLDTAGDLARNLVELLQNGNLRQRLGAGARKRWQNHFRYSAFRRRFKDILTHAFENRC